MSAMLWFQSWFSFFNMSVYTAAFPGSAISFFGHSRLIHMSGPLNVVWTAAISPKRAQKYIKCFMPERVLEHIKQIKSSLIYILLNRKRKVKLLCFTFVYEYII